MKIKQTVKTLVLGAMLFVAGFVVTAPVSVSAAQCGKAQTAIIACDERDASGEIEDTGAWGILLLAINILSAGVAVVALGGVVYASILYTSAGGSPEQVKKAMGMITNIVIGVIAYAIMFSLLNFLIPGGLFS